MRLLKNNGVKRFGASLLALSQVFMVGAVVTGCNRGGTGGGRPLGSTSAGATAGLNMGKIAYDMLHQSYEQSGETSKLAALEKRENDFIGAINRIMPADVGQNLFPTLLSLLPMVDDGTMENAVTDIDAILVELINDPQTLDSLAKLLNGTGAKSRSDDGRSMNVLLSRLLAYPEMEDLTKAILKLIRDNDGVDDQNQPNGERNLLRELLAMVSRQLQAYQPSASSTSPSTINKVLQDLKGALLADQPMKAFKGQLGAPAWAVRRDANGNPKVLADAATGRLPAPFVDVDGDGIADVNSSTQAPIDANGNAITLAPFGNDGTRDSFGRALAPGGGLYFDYYDAKKTFLSEALLLVGELVKQDSLGKAVQLIDGITDRVKHDNGTADPSDDYDTLAPTSPLIDLTYSGLELVKYTPLPDLLKGIAAIVKNDPAKFGNMVDTLLVALKQASTAAGQAPAPGANQALVNDLLPLLESATRPRGRGTSAVRALLQAFNTEQRRLQTLPVTFARMMKFHDYRNRIPADATHKSVMQRILDMMVAANRCNAPFAGNMAEFYLNAMAGNQRLLGFNISIGTIHNLLDIGLLRRLLCSGIKADDVRALQDFNDSGALAAMKPIAKVFSDRGETPLLKDIMLGLQAHYEAAMRPTEPTVVAILESGAVEKLFTVIDQMTQVRVPGKNLVVADALADTLQAVLDTGAPRYDRLGNPYPSLARLLMAPLDQLSAKAKARNLDALLSDLTSGLFDTLLATYVDDNNTADPSDDVERWKWEGLKSSLASIMETLGDTIPDDATDRARWAAEQQQELTRLMTGRDLVLVIDVLKTIAASPEKQVINKALANLFTPNTSAQFDVFGAIVTLLADKVESAAQHAAPIATVDQQALADVLHFAGRQLDPDAHKLDNVVIMIRRIIRADEGLLILRLARNALDKGPQGVDPSPVEIIQSVFKDIDAASGPATSQSGDRLKATLEKAHDFINDQAAGLPHFIQKIKNRPSNLGRIPPNTSGTGTNTP